jgi:hypothetical protein
LYRCHDYRQCFSKVLALHARGYVPAWHLVRAELLKGDTTLDDPLLFEGFVDAVPRPVRSNIPKMVADLRDLYEQRRMLQRLHAGENPQTVATDFLAATRNQTATTIRIYDDVSILEQEDPKPLIAPYWWQNSTACMVAPSGVGKTTLFISKGIAIAGNRPWMSVTPTLTGPVVLVVGEGSGFMKYRVLAAKLHAGLHDVDTPIGFHVIPDAIDFRESSQVGAFIERCRPLRPVLIGIDTLARAMPGGDDPSMKDIGTVLSNGDRVRQELGCSIEFLHHTGWNEERERGSSSLRGHVDTLTLMSKDVEGTITLHCDKQKDGPEFPDLRFRLTRLELGSDHSACVVDPVDTLHIDENETLTESYRLAYDVLQQTFPHGATQKQWLESMPPSFGKGAEARRQKLYRARRELLKRSLLEDKKGRLHAVIGGAL